MCMCVCESFVFSVKIKSRLRLQNPSSVNLVGVFWWLEFKKGAESDLKCSGEIA